VRFLHAASLRNKIGKLYPRSVTCLITSMLAWCIVVCPVLPCFDISATSYCSVLYYVLKLRTVISTLGWAVLTALGFGFCLTGSISLCLDSFMFMFVFFVCLSYCHTAYVLYHCNTVRWTWWDWSLILRTFLQCFDTVGWVIWPVKPRPRYDL